MKWFVLAVCSLGTESAPVDKPIPFSGGNGQIFASSDDLIKSFRRQKPASPESPAVIPIDGHLPDRLPTPELKPPLEPSRLSHLHLQSAQQHEQITEQNSTQKSVGSESSAQPNSESIEQSHHVTSEDSQPKSDFEPPGIPGLFVVLPVQIREIFPEQNSPVTSVPELPRPNLVSIQLPNHVHKVPEDDSPEHIKTGSDQPEHGPSDQLPKHVHEVLEEDAQQSVNPELEQPQHGISDQLPKHDHEVPEKDAPEPINTGLDQPEHDQSVQLPKHVHEVLEEDAQQSLSPELAQPQPSPSDQLPKHVHEVPEKDAPEPIKTRSDRPEHGQSVKLPKHVHEVIEEDAQQSVNPELVQPQHGPSDQFPKHDHEVPEKDAPEPIKTGLDQPEHDQSVQFPKHVHEVLEEDAHQSKNPELTQPQHGSSDQIPKHIHEVLEKDAPEPIKTGSDQPQHGQSDQLPKHVHEVPEKDAPEPIKTASDLPQHDQLPKHVQEVSEKDSPQPIFKPRLTPPRYGQYVPGKEGPEEDTPEPMNPGSDQLWHGQSDQLPKHVQEVSEKDPPQPIYKPSQLVQQLEDHVLPPLPLIPETKLSDFAQSLQRFTNLPRPEHDTPSKSISEPVRQNSERPQQLSEQVSIGKQQTPSSVAPEAPPRPNFDRSLHLFDDLIVPLSRYTETYDIEWHKESNTARTVIAGSMTIYRKLLPDGRIQYLEIKLDRTAGSQIRRCTMSPPLVPTSSVDTAFPGLPEMGPFQFSGYAIEESRSRLLYVEHWQYIVVGRPGQGGAAREESVNVTHDFFAFRDGSDAVPLRYTVTKDSSVLGPESETYTHRYVLLPAPTAAILPDTTRECDVLDELKEDKDRRRRTAGNVVG